MRACLLVLDSLGIGWSKDAAQFGDQGANTFGRILKDFDQRGGLHIPNLLKLGLGHAALGASDKELLGLGHLPTPIASYGFAEEQSRGKDTPSGHWEMTGFPVEFDWGYFPATIPCFPEDFVADFLATTGLTGLLGNCHASGIEIISKFGETHIKSGQPICYTSADSVFQIAAHESHFGLERLYQICEIAQTLLKPRNIGRVIARPFVGETVKDFIRTDNRKDYAYPPSGPTLLDGLTGQGHAVVAIGKISDIFAARGISQKIKASGNMALFDATLTAFDQAQAGTLIFTNFIDFDTLYGHRRDIQGYGKALEAFDQRLPELLGKMTDMDMLVITADHGCDPGWHGSDHTREHVPVLIYRPNQPSLNLGKRTSFADIGQTLASYFAIPPLAHGRNCLP